MLANRHYKLENLKIVRSGHQYTKTIEDEEVFWISTYPAIEKHYKDLNTTKNLKNRGPSIKVASISWFLIMNLTLVMFISPIMG